MKNITETTEYKKFLGKLKVEIISARQRVYQSINRQLVELYLNIGKGIYGKIEVSKWGEGVVETLANDLQREFPDMKGFSGRNLWEMKKLYGTYKDHQKLQPLVAELSWSHNLIILHQTEAIEEKEFYLKTCINEKWTRRELERQIGSSLYERFMLSKKTKGLIPQTKEKQIMRYFKDEYMFDFLGLKEEFSEKDLRRAIVQNIKQFFLEFGRYFTFVGDEHKITVGSEDYKVDLLFYHRLLRCMVAVDLLCGAPHNNFCVALPVMWRSADMHELYHNLYNNGDKTGHHIINRIREPVRNSSDLDRLVDEPFFLFDALRKEQGLSLSFRDRFQHKCWLC